MQRTVPERRGERGFSLLLLVFSVTAFWQSYQISGFEGLSTPGVFPMLSSATMVLASVCILIQSCLKSATTPDIESQDTAYTGNIITRRFVILVLLISGYVIAMPLLGFLFASSLFLLLSFKYLWQKSWLNCLVLTGASVAIVFLVFRQLFQVVLPKGLFFQAGLW